MALHRQHTQSVRAYCDILLPFTGSRAADPSVAVTDLTLDFDCWVCGQEIRCVFPVKILREEAVGTLRKVIKGEKLVEFCDIDPDTLVLYKVYNPLNKA